MFTKKNKLGFIILGVLILCVAAGSCMWVLSKQDAALPNAEREREQATDRYDTEREPEPEPDTVQVNSTVIVEDIEDIYRAKELNSVNCYATNIMCGGNHYWIDGQGTLWGTGTSEYGQLKEVREDLGSIMEPVEIAQHVKHVDFSGELFVIYLTEDDQLYGFGANPASVLYRSLMEDYRFIITEPVLLMEDVVYAKCGYSTIIALTENGEVYMRGEKKYIPFQGNTYPEPAKVMENAKYVTAYQNTFAVIDNDNNLWTWGDNRLGQCGVGTFSDQVQSPQKIMGHVDCAWMGQAAFNSTGEVLAQDNLIVLTKDGVFYGCGEGIGTRHSISGINDLDEAQEMIVSEKLIPISIQEFVPLSLKGVELLWSEEALKQFLEEHQVDYSVGYTDENNNRIYSANRNAWEFIFDDQGQLAVITSTKRDETEENRVKAGDPFEKVIKCYGRDYIKTDSEYHYFRIEYERADYNFQIDFYSDWGCARFSKCLKGFQL